jgi:hypothetical protein
MVGGIAACALLAFGMAQLILRRSSNGGPGQKAASA